MGMRLDHPVATLSMIKFIRCGVGKGAAVLAVMEPAGHLDMFLLAAADCCCCCCAAPAAPEAAHNEAKADTISANPIFVIESCAWKSHDRRQLFKTHVVFGNLMFP